MSFNQNTLARYMDGLKWQTTGNLCIDACMSAIHYERVKRGLPIKAIKVSTYYWHKALEWVEAKYKSGDMTVEQYHNIMESQCFTLDGVEVYPSGVLSATAPMFFEYWPKNQELN